MKKVLIGIMQLHKNAAGAVKTAYEQIRYFKALGWEVHVMSALIDKEAVRREGAIPHATLNWPGTGRLRRRFYNLQVQWWVRRHRPDLVVGHGDLTQQDVLVLHNSVHLAHELIHGKPLPESSEMWPIHTPQLRERRFRHLIANSNLMRDDLLKRFGLPPEMATVIYPSYDERKFTPVGSEERQRLRKGFGVASHELVVGLITSGNFKKRGVDLFFDAFTRLPEELRARTRIWVVGKDKLPPAPAHLRVEQMPVRDDVENYFRALDLFVLPARVEEFGRVQTEAMACGCPILSTAQVGASELLTGEARDHILGKADAQALADHMTRLLSDDALRARLSALSVSAVLPTAESQVAARFDQVFKKFL